jgi:ferredoxin--NADP+ reductase
MARLEDYDISNPFEAEVVENKRITPEDSKEELRDITVRPKTDMSEFEIGKHVGLLLSGESEFGSKYHFRLYSIAGLEDGTVTLCVKRVNYIDEYSGERYKGKASNFLCDRSKGDAVTLTGPYPGIFELPEDPNANMVLIGLGTGIAPFRAFIKHIYREKGGWQGKVRLFYGAKSGLDLAYFNREIEDLGQYYDEETFKAFQAISPRPHMDDPIDLEGAIQGHGEEVWQLMRDPDTVVFVAGLAETMEQLDSAMAEVAGSLDKWQKRKAELKAGERWKELLY